MNNILRIAAFYRFFVVILICFSVLTAKANEGDISLRTYSAVVENYQITGKSTVLICLTQKSAVLFADFSRNYLGRRAVFKIHERTIMIVRLVSMNAGGLHKIS